MLQGMPQGWERFSFMQEACGCWRAAPPRGRVTTKSAICAISEAMKEIDRILYDIRELQEPQTPSAVEIGRAYPSHKINSSLLCQQRFLNGNGLGQSWVRSPDSIKYIALLTSVKLTIFIIKVFVCFKSTPKQDPIEVQSSNSCIQHVAGMMIIV